MKHHDKHLPRHTTLRLLLLPFLVMLLGFTACRTKESTLQEYQALYKNVSERSYNYTEADWLDFLVSYHELDSLIDEYTYDDVDTREIQTIRGRCIKYVIEGEIKVKTAPYQKH